MNHSKNLAAFFLLLSVASTAMSGQETDAQTGLVIDQGFETVKQNCTACHSAKLITQAGATRESWQKSIRWMQQTQNLWQFAAETEKTILDYLAKNYAPKRTAARRAPLVVDKWYRLDAGASEK